MMVRTKNLFVVIVICASFSTAWGMKRQMKEKYKQIPDEKKTEKSFVVVKKQEAGLGERKISFEDLLFELDKVPLHCVMKIKEKKKIKCGCFLFLK